MKEEKEALKMYPSLADKLASDVANLSMEIVRLKRELEDVKQANGELCIELEKSNKLLKEAIRIKN